MKDLWWSLREGENKGFSPPFDIFSPLVKATFQQFGTFLLMLMLLTRNSISFHFVRPPAPRPLPPPMFKISHNHQAMSRPDCDNLWMERLGKYWLESICSRRKGIREWRLRLNMAPGRNWDWWGFMRWHWGLDRIIGIFVLKSMSLLRQAAAKRVLIHTNHHIYSHKPSARLICLHFLHLTQCQSIIDERPNLRQC